MCPIAYIPRTRELYADEAPYRWVVTGVVVPVAGAERDFAFLDEGRDAEPIQLRLKQPLGVGERVITHLYRDIAADRPFSNTWAMTRRTSAGASFSRQTSPIVGSMYSRFIKE